MKRGHHVMTADEFVLWSTARLENTVEIAVDKIGFDPEAAADLLEEFVAEVRVLAANINPLVYARYAIYPNNTFVRLWDEKDGVVREVIRAPWDSENLDDYFGPEMRVIE